MILFLLRRLSHRGRRNVGLGLVALGLALVVVAVAVASGLLVHGLVIAVIGAAVVAHSVKSERRARVAVDPSLADGASSARSPA